jgi:RNA polymerase sporulation-specific sigma factor
MIALGDWPGAGGELVARAQAGSAAAFKELARRHQRMIEREAARFFLPGAGPDDVVQEALIGFFKAVCAYRAASGDFTPFARLCVRRQIRSALTAARRRKHSPMNEAAQLESVSETGAPSLDDPRAEPAATLIARERLVALSSAGRHLTELERIALGHALLGWSTGEIARRVGRPRKVMDNALQRARRKLEALEQERAA